MEHCVVLLARFGLMWWRILDNQQFFSA